MSGSNGADSTSHQIFKIAVDSATQELIAEFGTSGHEWIDGVAVLKYYKKVNGEKVRISEEEMQELCKSYPTPSVAMTRDEAKLTYHPSSDDARMQLLLIAPPYRDALESLIPVYDALSGEPTYMRDVKDPYSATSLLVTGDCLSYAYVDLDGDGEKEIVISCPGGTLLLRHYEGRIYLYQFTFKSLYNLKTDGTYDFGYTAGDFVYGEKCIAFDGARLIEKEIFRIVNNSEFYLDNRQVTEAELLQYIESQPPKSDVLFAPIAFSWQYPVSSTDAIEIANEYWGFPDHRQEGACGTRLVLRVVLYDSPLEDQHEYKISLVRYAYPSGDSEGGVSYRKEVLESVYINAYTCTCTKMEAPPFDDGK